jgi:hypothetical protein
MQLVAYVEPVPGGTLTVVELRHYLEHTVPRFMVPSAFVILERMPLTANGKLDQAALPEPQNESKPEHKAPRTELEVQVAEIWEEVLGVAGIGLRDSFWDLGGHSLLAAKVFARLEDMLGAELRIQLLFDAPKLVDFTAAIGAALLAQEDV